MELQWNVIWSHMIWMFKILKILSKHATVRLQMLTLHDLMCCCAACWPSNKCGEILLEGEICWDRCSLAAPHRDICSSLQNTSCTMTFGTAHKCFAISQCYSVRLFPYFNFYGPLSMFCCRMCLYDKCMDARKMSDLFNNKGISINHSINKSLRRISLQYELKMFLMFPQPKLTEKAVGCVNSFERILNM